MLDTSNMDNGPLTFHDAVSSRLSTKENLSTQQLILEELRTKTQGYTKQAANAEDTVAVYYYTFMSDFIKHRKKYSLSDKADALYSLFKDIIDQDLQQGSPKIPGLFSKDKQLMEVLLNDFSNAKQLNIDESCILGVLLRYVSATGSVEMDVLFKKFTEVLLTTLLERKGKLVKKALSFIEQFFAQKSSKNSDALRASIEREVIHVLETFKINTNKTLAALALVPIVFDFAERGARAVIHNHLNSIILSNVDKQIKVKALFLIDELSTKYSLDVSALEQTLQGFNTLREESLFLMLDKNFVKTFIKCYLNVVININKSDNSKGRRYFPTLLSMALDLLFETDNIEREVNKRDKDAKENVTAVRNKYRLKRDITSVICTAIENAIDTDTLKYNVNEDADLAELIASIDLKTNNKGLESNSSINRIMALIVYSLNDNFGQYFGHIDKVVRCLISQLDEVGALNSGSEVIKTFSLILFEKIKLHSQYDNAEALLAFLLDKIDLLFEWLAAEMDRSLQNEEFTYLLLLIQKHCNRIRFNSLGEQLFAFANDLIFNANNSGNENSAVVNLVRALGKFKKFERKDLKDAEGIITNLQHIIFNESLSEEIRRPFIDILQFFFIFCSENKSKLKRGFFDMLVNKSKSEILFGNICKGLLTTHNQYLQIIYENILKLLAFLLPHDYIVPMLINNIRQLMSKMENSSDLPKEIRIIIVALEATSDLHSHINLYEAATDLVNLIIKNEANLSTAIKLLTSIAHNVNETYFAKVQEMFNHALAVAQKNKNLSGLKASLKFIKDVIEKNQGDAVGSQKAEAFLESHLDFVFLNFKNRNTKTRLIVREIIAQSFSKYEVINDTNRLFAIILSGLATDKSKGNFIEVLNFVLKKRFNDFEPTLKQNVAEILILLMADKDKAVIGALLKTVKTMAKFSDEQTIRAYLRFMLDALNEHNPDMVAAYREKIKKIFQILIKRFVS